MTRNWLDYWTAHAAKAGADDPLVGVQRTKLGRPISDDDFAAIRDRAVAALELSPKHHVLDLCCGNGLFTAAIEPGCAHVVGVDFCEPLLAAARDRAPGAEFINADAREVEFPAGTFDRILVAAALQHFELAEVVRLVRRIAMLLGPGGVFLATDIPEQARMWAFFDTPEREEAHFAGLEAGASVIGTWFDRSWLVKLARHAGFRDAAAQDQPAGLPDAHYRFDLRCVL